MAGSAAPGQVLEHQRQPSQVNCIVHSLQDMMCSCQGCSELQSCFQHHQCIQQCICSHLRLVSLPALALDNAQLFSVVVSSMIIAPTASAGQLVHCSPAVSKKVELFEQGYCSVITAPYACTSNKATGSKAFIQRVLWAAVAAAHADIHAHFCELGLQ